MYRESWKGTGNATEAKTPPLARNKKTDRFNLQRHADVYSTQSKTKKGQGATPRNLGFLLLWKIYHATDEECPDGRSLMPEIVDEGPYHF